jgi:hypothetical protein
VPGVKAAKVFIFNFKEQKETDEMISLTKISDIPSDAIKDHLTPFLNVTEIIELSSTNNFFHMFYSEDSIFKEELWRERSLFRWKSVDFVVEPRHPWLDAYKNRHKQDRLAYSTLREIDALYKRRDALNSNQDISDEISKRCVELIRQGVDILDMLQNCNSCHDESSEDEEAFSPLVLEQIRKGIIQNDIFKKIHLISLNDHTVTLEQGAILITRYHCIEHDLHIDDSKGEMSIEEYAERELDGLAAHLLHRLRQSTGNTNGNATSFPIRRVLEEMKYFFRSAEDEPDRDMISEEISDMKLTHHDPVDTSTPFLGNNQNYYAAKNSMMHKILKNRCGIPISLAILYRAIVKRATGITLNPVGLPGHFMLSVTIPRTEKNSAQDETVFVDAFHGGSVQNLEEVKAKIIRNFGIQWDDQFSQRIPNYQVW